MNRRSIFKGPFDSGFYMTRIFPKNETGFSINSRGKKKSKRKIEIPS